MINDWFHWAIVSSNLGTTDSPCEVTDNPTPSEEEIQFILKEVRNYLNPDVNGELNFDRTVF